VFGNEHPFVFLEKHICKFGCASVWYIPIAQKNPPTKHNR